MKIAYYDNAVNPVYQVDWSCQEIGKRIASSKRRIIWKFGIANATKYQEGAVGVDCRGEEHELIIDWSLRSGKRAVMFDDETVHCSVEPYSPRFEAAVAIGEHSIRIVCHASSTPVFSTAGFRQYDMELDGRSFFDMPCIFELGMKNNTGNVAAFPDSTLPIPFNHTFGTKAAGMSDSLWSDVTVVSILENERVSPTSFATIGKTLPDIRDSPPRQEEPAHEDNLISTYNHQVGDIRNSSTQPTFPTLVNQKSLPQTFRPQLDMNFVV